MAAPIAPTLLFPETTTFSTNMNTVSMIGSASLDTSVVLVNGEDIGLVLTVAGDHKEFVHAVTVIIGEQQQFTYVATNNDGNSPALVVSVIGENRAEFFARDTYTPTGISTRVFGDRVEVYWYDFPDTTELDNSFVSFIGYNVYFALGPGLSKNSLLRLNSDPVSVPFDEKEEVISETSDDIVSGDEHTTIVTKRIRKRKVYRFRHYVGNISAEFKERPIFYRISSIFFDSSLGFLYESLFSDEISATPLQLNTGYVDLPLPSFRDFVQFYVENVRLFDTTIDVKPGSVFRDTVIDPTADSLTRLYFLLNFMSRSQSFITLLDIDDPNKDGVSDPVASVAYKRNLKTVMSLSNDDVQLLVDTAFDKLANNVNVRRKAATSSVGEILLYATKKPDGDIEIPRGSLVMSVGDSTRGIQSVTFETTSDIFLSVDRVDDLYNPDTGRYELTIPARAASPGSVGNVDVGAITVNISAGTAQLPNVYNLKPFAYGQDYESNRDLAARAMLAFVSVDVGTEGGYKASALGVSGVQRVSVVGAGHDLMQRDYDCLCNRHLLGDVDVYVLGQDTAQTVENTIVAYKIKSGIGSVVNFATLKVAINTGTDTQIALLEASNVTRGYAYDVSGAIVSANEWTLLANTQNTTIGMAATDVIFMKVKINDIEDYILVNQPVSRVISVESERSGVIAAGSDYDLFKTEDPLILGESNKASDFIRLYENLTLFNPTLINRSVTQVLVSEDTVKLPDLGIEPSTVTVVEPIDSAIYVSVADYLVIGPDNEGYYYVRRVEGGDIPDGTEVVISYDSPEKLSISYEFNNLLNRVASVVDTKRHITADIAIKSVRSTALDIDMSVVLDQGVSSGQVDFSIRSRVGEFFGGLGVGESVHQSDIVAIIEGVPGVNYVIIPLKKMVIGDGSLVVREPISFLSFTLTASTPYKVFTSANSVLSHKTVATGGDDKLPRGVFVDGKPMELMETQAEVALRPGRAYIHADGKISISLLDADPLKHSFAVTYQVYGETGANEASASDNERLVLGDLTVTYKEVA